MGKIVVVFLCLFLLAGCSNRATNSKDNNYNTDLLENHSPLTESKDPAFDASSAPRSMTLFLRTFESDDERDENVISETDGKYTTTKKYDKDGNHIASISYSHGRADIAYGYNRFDDGNIKFQYVYTSRNDGFVLDHVDQYERGAKYPTRTFKYSTNSGYLTGVLEYGVSDETYRKHPQKREYYEDGVLSSYATYSYNDKYQIVEKAVFDSTGKSTEQYVQKFDELGHITELTGYNEIGTVFFHAVANYSVDGYMDDDYVYENEVLTFEMHQVYQNGNPDHLEYVQYEKDGTNPQKGSMGGYAYGPAWGLDSSREFDTFWTMFSN